MNAKKTNSEEPSSKYVSRAGDKLALAVKTFKIAFRNLIVLDIGSSTGGFTDFALQNGAKKVIAIEKGTRQLHPKLQNNPKIELHEKTDILNFTPKEPIDLILADVSFISLTKILKYARLNLSGPSTRFLVMLKPQFEAKPHQLINGKVKNSKIRREIIKTFEQTISKSFKIIAKQDNHLPGREEGNLERFYYLKPIKNSISDKI